MLLAKFRRIINKRCIILLFIGIVFNIGLFLYKQFSVQGIETVIANNGIYNNILSQYNYSAIDIKNDIRNIRNDERYLNNKKTINDIGIQVNYIVNYNDYVNGIIDNAENLKKKALFYNSQSTSYKKISKTSDDYSKLKDTKLSLQNYNGINKYFDYYEIFLINLAACLYIVYRMFDERKNNMWVLVRGTQNGRLKLSFIRALFLFLFSFIYFFINSVLVFVISGLIYGFVDFSVPIQSIMRFKDYTCIQSVISFIIKFNIYQWITLLAFIMIFWAFMSLFKNRNVPIILSSIIIGIEYMFYKSSADSTLMALLRRYNVINFINLEKSFEIYNNTNVFGIIINSISFTIIVISLLVVVASVLGVIASVFISPEKKTVYFDKIISRIEVFFQKILVKLPVILKELHKMFFTSRGYIVIFYLIILSVLIVDNSRIEYSDDEIKEDQIYVEHGGKDYSYIINTLKKADDKMNEANELVKEMGEKYNRGEANITDVIRANAKLDACLAEIQSFKGFEKKINYLEELKREKGIEGWLVSDREYDEILGKNSTVREIFLFILTIGGILLITRSIIRIENSSKMNMLNNTTQKGRNWLFIRKITASVIISAVIFAVIYSIDVINWIVSYDMPFLDAPLQSLTDMYNFPFAVSIRTYMGLALLFKLILSVFASVFVTIVQRRGHYNN